MAPWVGIEPTTKRLTVACSTAELPRNMFLIKGTFLYYQKYEEMAKVARCLLCE